MHSLSPTARDYLPKAVVPYSIHFKLVSDNDHASHPYSKVGKQCVFTRCNAEVSFDCLPITDIILLN